MKKAKATTKNAESKKTGPKLIDIIRSAGKLSEPYRVSNGRKFSLADYKPGDTGRFDAAEKQEATEALAAGVKGLADLQDVLYANRQWSLLLIFQAMDAAGKDGAIKHVMSGINPQGCQVASFKAPSSEDLDHDFLWRCQLQLPERGRIGIFNRSYYEEVLVVQVHPEILQSQRLPKKLITPKIWKHRFEDIRAFEEHLSNSGVIVRKFFLHLSRDEQKRRFLGRIEDPAKNWKFSSTDMKERGYWKDYARAYENMIQETATKESPWYVVPADNKWYTRIVVAAAVIDALASLELSYPSVDKNKLAELAQAKAALLAE
jgi:PPK2 family polyphosphate:nucleotide phosphotransferase